MTATWLKHFRKRARGREWIKGAVNYDEDLHFSSYYLRASCTAYTRRLYPGYSCFVACYDGFNETYYLPKDECRSCAAAIVERALRAPGWLFGILGQIRRRSDSLAEIFPPVASPDLLAKLANSRLISLYRRHDASQRALYKYARLPEALDRGESYFTNYLLEHLRSRGVSASACAEAFDLLSQPVVPSVLAQEMLEFDDIVAAARSRVLALPPALSPSRARMRLDPDLFGRLETHRRKWQFLPYHGYGRRELASLNQYIDRLLEQSRQPDMLANVAGLTARCAQAGRLRNEMLDRLQVDAPHRALFEAYPEIGAVKLYRRYAQLKNFYYLDMLLAEVARRLNVSEWTIRCMLPEEILAALRARRIRNSAFRERLEGCIFAGLDGQERIITGVQAAELRNLVRPLAHGPRETNVLRGVVASRGKAAGPCKVLIRADDCRNGFEKGAIVVSESTDPDLVRFLRAAGGVLTEQGGVTSHAAIICRELGIPTIIGIDGLLERVRDGDWVEIDAEQGIVTLTAGRTRLERDETPTPHDPRLIGAKAWNLGVVRSLGFRVPEFVLLNQEEAQRVARRPTSRASSKIVQRLLAELSVSNGDKLALRSSSISEDREDGSQAGQYHSFLNVDRKEVATALRDFVVSNRLGRNGTVYRGSVIVQRMIRADWAGVCLTRDTRTRHGEAVIIEMTAGGNEGVTGGTVRPERVVVDRQTGDILDEERLGGPVHGPAVDIAWMVQQFLSLEARFGKPLDIEWALAGRELYILQARPIVAGRHVAMVDA